MSYSINKIPMSNQPSCTDHESYLRPFFQAMMDSGYSWCVLHSADDLPYFSSSDVDIVVAGDISHGIEKLIHTVADNTGWVVIQVLWYDVQYGRYYVLKDQTTGVYLAVDILSDSDGLGSYGFKTSQLVEEPKFNGVFNQTNSNVEFAYKLVKRIEKEYFTEEDKELFVKYYQCGDKVKQQVLLNAQYGQKVGADLLNRFKESNNIFPDFTKKDFKHFKQKHFIQRKLVSLQLPRILAWQLLRLKDRVQNPCGVVITIPSARKKDAKKVLGLLKERMDLSFRAYTIAASNNKKAILSALITSKLCVVYHQIQHDVMPTQYQLREHWVKPAISINASNTELANKVFAETCSESEQLEYTDFLEVEVEKILIKRVGERSHV